MSTPDQKLSAEIHGLALLLARDGVPQELLDRLAKAAQGRDDLRTELAGEIAGYWMADPASHHGHELIAAGLLLISGVVDGDQLLDAARTGYERGKSSFESYAPSR